MNCSSCGHCVRQRKTIYGDGSEVVTFNMPEAKGWCVVFERDVDLDFGCKKYISALGQLTSWDHCVITRKEGSPWQNWTMIPCPDCDGRGSTHSRACRRCSGTARVRRYDDGYVADETWDHPKEKERKRALNAPTKLDDPNLTLRPLPSAGGGVTESGAM